MIDADPIDDATNMLRGLVRVKLEIGLKENMLKTDNAKPRPQ